MFESKFCTDNYNDWRYSLIRIEISDTNSDRIIDLMNFINHYNLNKNYMCF